MATGEEYLHCRGCIDFFLLNHTTVFLEQASPVKIPDTVTGGSVLASGAQPPASVTICFQSSLCQQIIDEDRQTDERRT